MSMVKNRYLVEIENVRFWVFCSIRKKKVYEHGEKRVFGENTECLILCISLKQEESGT